MGPGPSRNRSDFPSLREPRDSRERERERGATALAKVTDSFGGREMAAPIWNDRPMHFGGAKSNSLRNAVVEVENDDDNATTTLNDNSNDDRS